METQNSAFGQKLKQLRQEKKYSMRTVARLMDVSQSYVSKLESGARSPSREVVLKLAAAFWPEKNTRAQDELLILAGFLPESPELLSQSLDEGTQLKQNWQQAPHDIYPLKQYLIYLIKSGDFQSAQKLLNSSFQYFQNSVTLQSLIAFLELSKQNYDQAVQIQRAALEQYATLNARAQTEINEGDLRYDLGEIYFFKAYHFLQVKQQAESENQKKKAREALKISKDAFQSAREAFSSALQLDPENVSYLEEYARVNFNLAEISSNKAAQSFWQTTIQSYRELLVKDTYEILGEQRSREIGLFLAHAYTKTQAFEQAELLLDTIAHYCRGYAFLFYVKACMYSLWYAHSPQEQLSEALKALEKALRLSENPVLLKRQILQEPDLVALRSERQKDFNRLIQ